MLPVVDARATATGVELVRRSSDRRASFWTMLVLGVIGTLVGLGWPLAGLLTAGAWGGSLTLTLFGVVGVGLLGASGWQGYQMRALGDAHLDLPRVPLRLGEPVVIRYSQRRQHRAEVRSVTATLMCREWVEFRSGTETETRTHVLWTSQLPPDPNDPIGDRAVISGAWRVTLPPELPPSFSAPDNALQWILTIHADIANRPDAKNEYVLPVAPEVVRDLR